MVGKSIKTYVAFEIEKREDLKDAADVLLEFKYLRTGRTFLIPEENEEKAATMLTKLIIPYMITSRNEKVLIK